VEIGNLAGAAFRIDMPTAWNGILLIYYHGYTETPIHYDVHTPNPIGSGFAAAGFAVAQSAYSVTGWSIEWALAETEALREYTIAHYGQPKESYVMGHSLGGYMTLATIEHYPNRYDGGLALCAVAEPATRAITKTSALLAAFHYYYPGLLPGPLSVAPTAALDENLAHQVQAALASNPTGLAEMLAIGRLKSDADLASGIVFAAYVIRDLEQKTGASVFDNHNWIYAGGADDNALNKGVKRYTADRAALAYLATWYTPSGLLRRPVLAVHTTYDPIVLPEVPGLYSDAVERAGSSELFVQQFVAHDGHCAITGAETAAALHELIEWKRTGDRPASGPVPEPAR
jgi:pimeloyl-ACP methyl ester carboxylesterase